MGESFKSLDNGLLERSLISVTAAQASLGFNVWQYAFFIAMSCTEFWPGQCEGIPGILISVF